MASFSTKTYQGLTPLVLPDQAGIRQSVVDVDFADAGASVAANDIVTLAVIPANTKVVDFSIHLDDIDTNGTPTVAFSFGELNGAGTDMGTAYQSSITSGQTGGVTRNTAAPATLATNQTADRRLGLKATAGAATSALAGKKGQVVLYLSA